MPPAGVPFDPRQVTLAGVQLIEASAGTGKTWNICALYLRILLERELSVREVLVITFTKAAIAELRERIRARLVGLLLTLDQATGQGDALLEGLLADALARLGADRVRIRARLVLALQEFDQAAIFTIHSFCQRALSDAPFVAAVPFDRVLLADDEALRVEVAQDFWRRMVSAQVLPMAFAAEMLDRRAGPEQLAGVLRRHVAKPLSRTLWPADIETAAIDAGAARRVMQAWASLAPLWRAEHPHIVGQVMARLGQLTAASYTAASVAKARAEWDALVRNDDPWGSFDAADSKLKLFRQGRLEPTKAALKAGATPPAHPFFNAAEDFLAARSDFAASLQTLRLRLVRDMLAECVPGLRSRKRALRVQSFDDLLSGLHDALHGPLGAALVRSLRERYPLALVDEFQDTDPLQLDILRTIYGSASEALFLVGDPKQAIYSFRNADLPTYLQARAGADATWTLTHNQRSSPALIHALNTLFLCNPQPFRIEQLGYPAVVTGTRPRAVLRGDPLARAALQVWLLPQGESGEPLRAPACRDRVAESCAGEIVRLLQAGADGLLRLGERGLQAGDIAVLVRSHAEGQRMRSALEWRGVACVELSQANIFASRDAEEVLWILRAIADPGRAGGVAAALATVLLGYQANVLEELRAQESALGAVMLDFAGALEWWHARGFGVMFRRFLEQQQVYPRLLARPDGARRLTNLRHLVELLHAASDQHSSPAALLRWLRARIADPDTDETHQLRLESDEHLVQVVTVHRAKGLEYPVVFCPDLWAARPAEGRTAGGARDYHDADGAAVIDYRRSEELSRQEDEEIRARIALDADAEQLRLIYVALTRAATRCYLVAGAYDNARGDTARCDVSGRTPLNWLACDDAPDFATWRGSRHSAAQIEARWLALAAVAGDPAALAVERLPPATAQRRPSAEIDAALVRAQPPPVRIAPRQRVGSYSALQIGALAAAEPVADREVFASLAGRDHDALATALAIDVVDRTRPAGSAANSEAAATTKTAASTGALEGAEHAAKAVTVDAVLAADDILQFPRGTLAGTCIHALLERVDLADGAHWATHIARTLKDYPGLLPATVQQRARPQWAAMLLRLLGDLAATTLPPGFRLADLDPCRRLHELEFHLPAANLRPEQLQAVLRRHGHAAPSFRFEPLEGYLKGFIDLVFEHQGRWYVLDWKSNHLGDSVEDYAMARVQSAMDEHAYVLQALLYLLALHRFLARRLPDYDPDRHLGGALYLFVRGVRPHWVDTRCGAYGVWHYQPRSRVLEDLAAALAGASPETAS